jgi:hypothetical protein
MSKSNKSKSKGRAPKFKYKAFPVEGVFNFRPGWLVVDCSSASGGIRYDRELVKEKSINEGHGLRADHKTRKTVDHVAFCAAVDAIVKKVDYVLRKHCARTQMGWFADDKALRKVKAEIAEIAREAEDLNTNAAKKAQSARRAYISVAPLKLDPAHPEAVQEISRTIRGTLTELRDALRTGDVASLHKLRIRSTNLAQLAVGFQSDAIRFALECVPVAALKIREARKHAERAAKNSGENAATIEEAATAAAKRAGAKVDIEAIEAAIMHFEDSPLAARDKAA